MRADNKASQPSSGTVVVDSLWLLMIRFLSGSLAGFDRSNLHSPHINPLPPRDVYGFHCTDINEVPDLFSVDSPSAGGGGDGQVGTLVAADPIGDAMESTPDRFAVGTGQFVDAEQSGNFADLGFDLGWGGHGGCRGAAGVG